MACAPHDALEACGTDDHLEILQHSISVLSLNASAGSPTVWLGIQEDSVYPSVLLYFLALPVFCILIASAVATLKSNQQVPASTSEWQILGGIAPSSFILANVGTVFEWLDFGLYGFFTAELGDAFFPADSQFTSIALTFATFAGAFVMRPLGGALAGYVGDCYGRVMVLKYCIAGMILSTFVIALLPPQRRIGIAAPILIIVARLIQGLSVGGQLPGSIIYVLESAMPHRRCLVSSLLFSSASVGIMLSSAVSTTAHSIRGETPSSWVWRCSFLTAGILGVVASWVSWKAEEPEEYVVAAESMQTRQRLFSEAFQLDWIGMLKMGLVPSTWAAPYYILFVWMPTYQQHLRPDPTLPCAFALNTAALGLLSILLIFWGWLADHIKIETLMYSALSLFFLISLLVFPFFEYTQPEVIFAAYVLFAIPMTAFGAVVPIWLYDCEACADVTRRCATISITHGVSVAVFAGPAPWLSTQLIRTSWGMFGPALYISCLCILAVLGMVLAPQQKPAAAAAAAA